MHHLLRATLLLIFTSRVSGGGNRIGPVWVCVCNDVMPSCDVTKRRHLVKRTLPDSTRRLYAISAVALTVSVLIMWILPLSAMVWWVPDMETRGVSQCEVSGGESEWDLGAWYHGHQCVSHCIKVSHWIICHIHIQTSRTIYMKGL